MLKNQRHELFLREYIQNGWNGKQAYAKVYSPVKSAEVQASKLLAKPAVRKRFNQMLKRIVKRAEITEERILGKYEEAFDMAQAAGKTADMISAASAQAKLVGLIRERLEAGSPGDFDRLENPSDVLEALEERVGPEVAKKIGEALGILQPVEAEQEAQPEANLAELLPPSGSVN